MNAKTSLKAATRDAKREDAAARKPKGAPLLHGTTADSFVNFAHRLGVGADNALSTGTYGYNPITRNRILLEWIHRGSWLGGQAIDVIADDMTRAGVDILGDLAPEDMEKITRAATTMNLWPQTNETIKWSRLYGGAVAAMLIDGQDMKTPLRVETVGTGQFKGLLTLDRWMIDPVLEDLVTDFGPCLGLPKFYRVQSNAPALRGQVIHYSRLAFRLIGVELPYQQRLTENLWGISVLERLYDRMIAFDSATTGAAQIVFKCYLRTLKLKGMRDVVAAGGKALDGLMQYTEVMRRYQGIEGVTLIDGDDEFEVQQTSAISGIDKVLLQLAQQLSGALQIPLVRLLGQSPTGMSATGESDIRNYYDGINQRQNKELHTGMATILRLIAQSEGVKVPDNFGIQFRDLWQLDAVQKAEVADKAADAVSKANDAGLIGRQTSLRELRQTSRITGIFTNITEQMIDEADDEVLPPLAESLLGHEQNLEMTDKTHEHGLESSEHSAELARENAEHNAKLEKQNARPQGNTRKTADGSGRRVRLQHEA